MAVHLGDRSATWDVEQGGGHNSATPRVHFDEVELAERKRAETPQIDRSSREQTVSQSPGVMLGDRELKQRYADEAKAKLTRCSTAEDVLRVVNASVDAAQAQNYSDITVAYLSMMQLRELTRAGKERCLEISSITTTGVCRNCSLKEWAQWSTVHFSRVTGLVTTAVLGTKGVQESSEDVASSGETSWSSQILDLSLPIHLASQLAKHWCAEMNAVSAGKELNIEQAIDHLEELFDSIDRQYRIASEMKRIEVLARLEEEEVVARVSKRINTHAIRVLQMTGGNNDRQFKDLILGSIAGIAGNGGRCTTGMKMLVENTQRDDDARLSPSSRVRENRLDSQVKEPYRDLLKDVRDISNAFGVTWEATQRTTELATQAIAAASATRIDTALVGRITQNIEGLKRDIQGVKSDLRRLSNIRMQQLGRTKHTCVPLTMAGVGLISEISIAVLEFARQGNGASASWMVFGGFLIAQGLSEGKNRYDVLEIEKVAFAAEIDDVTKEGDHTLSLLQKCKELWQSLSRIVEYSERIKGLDPNDVEARLLKAQMATEAKTSGSIRGVCRIDIDSGSVHGKALSERVEVLKQAPRGIRRERSRGNIERFKAARDVFAKSEDLSESSTSSSTSDSVKKKSIVPSGVRRRQEVRERYRAAKVMMSKETPIEYPSDEDSSYTSGSDPEEDLEEALRMDVQRTLGRIRDGQAEILNVLESPRETPPLESRSSHSDSVVVDLEGIPGSPVVQESEI